MRKLIMTACIIFFWAMPTQAADGLINVQSTLSVQETADRLENILKERKMTVFNRIKHSEGAMNVGIELRNTELIIFGNPKVGSPLIKCGQSVAIDLPQKALIWEDEEKNVWISYNDPQYLAQRHQIVGCEEILTKIANALAGIAESASKK
jgi:uncharacterized protein (DUF302 family)